MLVRLSHVAPMSVFACLGQEAVPIRDAFVGRLKAHVEVSTHVYTGYCYFTVYTYTRVDGYPLH